MHYYTLFILKIQGGTVIPLGLQRLVSVSLYFRIKTYTMIMHKYCLHVTLQMCLIQATRWDRYFQGLLHGAVIVAAIGLGVHYVLPGLKKLLWR